VQIALMKFLESHWDRSDHGLWEVRGRRQHFTHSKIMAWVAFDRAVKDAEKGGSRDRWKNGANCAMSFMLKCVKRVSMPRTTLSFSRTRRSSSMQACC
jgi:GH15 family glucan-1,4-alpha-glucosidase